MTETRMRPTTVGLADGRVLVLGGRGGDTGEALATAEIYDPATAQFSATGSIAGPRYVPGAVLLQDGQVLVVGGLNGRNVDSSAELYDPATGTFSATGSMTVPRIQQEIVRLADGRVLVAGGDGEEGPLASAELYDPLSGTFSLTGSLPGARVAQSLVLLTDGKVLMVAGSDGGFSGGFPVYYPTAVLYDPVSGMFTPTGSLEFPREVASVGRLPDGRVLVAGGSYLAGNPGSVAVATAELYDPTTGVFSEAGNLVVPRYETTPVTLADTASCLPAVGPSRVTPWATCRPLRRNATSPLWRTSYSRTASRPTERRRQGSAGAPPGMQHERPRYQPSSVSPTWQEFARRLIIVAWRIPGQVRRGHHRRRPQRPRLRGLSRRGGTQGARARAPRRRRRRGGDRGIPSRLPQFGRRATRSRCSTRRSSATCDLARARPARSSSASSPTSCRCRTGVISSRGARPRRRPKSRSSRAAMPSGCRDYERRLERDRRRAARAALRAAAERDRRRLAEALPDCCARVASASA